MSGLASKWATDESLVEEALKQDKKASSSSPVKDENKWSKTITSKKHQPLASKWADAEDDYSPNTPPSTGDVPKRLSFSQEEKTPKTRPNKTHPPKHNKPRPLDEVKDRSLDKSKVLTHTPLTPPSSDSSAEAPDKSISLANNPLAARLGLLSLENQGKKDHGKDKDRSDKGGRFQDRSDTRSDRNDRTFQKHDRHERVSEKHDKHEKFFDRSLHKHEKPLNKHDRSFNIHDKPSNNHDKPFSSHDKPKHDKPFNKLDKQPHKNDRPLNSHSQTQPKSKQAHTKADGGASSSKASKSKEEEDRIESEMLKYFEQLDSKTIDWTRIDD